MNTAALPPVLPPRPPAPPRSYALVGKLAVVGFLLLFLEFVPLGLMRGVLHDREDYRSQATAEITADWGRQQVVTGPVLAVPYLYKVQVIRPRVVNARKVDVEEQELVPATAFFLPGTLAVTGGVAPEVRHRGIYQTVVYTATVQLSGTFQPDFIAAGIEADQVDWAHARVLFGVSDLHGVAAVGGLKLGAAPEADFAPADDTGGLLPLAAKAAGVAPGARLDFSIPVRVRGSGQIGFVPVGSATAVSLDAAWADPSFNGALLPTSTGLDASGFKARWESTRFSHGFPQAWTNRAVPASAILDKFQAAAFGVRFATPVDAYSMVERTEKYALLFFTLVFAAFFLFEVTGARRIHPLQYAIVGAALCLFYLGFLALSELWTVPAAYGTAAATCTAMIALYAWSFLGTGWRTVAIAAGLAGTYGYLFFVLQSEDYALVAGTAALFAVLALVMLGTRRLNWYALDLPGTANAGQQGEGV